MESLFEFWIKLICLTAMFVSALACFLLVFSSIKYLLHICFGVTL